jgi:hypothetical protein
MSDYYYLLCKETNECIEVIASVGAKPGPRIEANALQAFLLYQHMVTGPYNCPSLTIMNIDSIGEDPYRNTVYSLEEMQQDIDQNSWMPDYATPILIWTDENYRALSSRLSDLNKHLSDYESAISGGTWVRKTIAGRII